MTAVQRWLMLPLAVWLLVSCSNQTEGERCDRKSGNADCEAPLVCTDVGNRDLIFRCCPSDGTYTDSRCQPGGSVGAGGAGGANGTGGHAGSVATGGVAAGGTSGSGGNASVACTHNSDCSTGLVCGPTGKCQVECVADRDCASPLVCRSNHCVASGGAGGGGGAP